MPRFLEPSDSGFAVWSVEDGGLEELEQSLVRWATFRSISGTFSIRTHTGSLKRDGTSMIL